MAFMEIEKGGHRLLLRSYLVTEIANVCRSALPEVNDARGMRRGKP